MELIPAKFGSKRSHWLDKGENAQSLEHHLHFRPDSPQ